MDGLLASWTLDLAALEGPTAFDCPAWMIYGPEGGQVGPKWQDGALEFLPVQAGELARHRPVVVRSQAEEDVHMSLLGESNLEFEPVR